MLVSYGTRKYVLRKRKKARKIITRKIIKKEWKKRLNLYLPKIVLYTRVGLFCVIVLYKMIRQNYKDHINFKPFAISKDSKETKRERERIMCANSIYITDMYTL